MCPYNAWRHLEGGDQFGWPSNHKLPLSHCKSWFCITLVVLIHDFASLVDILKAASNVRLHKALGYFQLIEFFNIMFHGMVTEMTFIVSLPNISTTFTAIL